jgi:putative endonuclease
MTYFKKEIGKMGEDLACNYLEELGHEIIRRNYLDRLGEIDIIAYKNYKFHFIEVKTVSRETEKDVTHETLWNPAEKINRKKLTRLEKVAQKFLFENGLEEEAYQFDLIIIFVYDGGFKYKIDVLENINLD